jgi:hypothetical protein
MATKARKKFRSETRHTARQERKKKTAAAKPFDGPAVELLCDPERLPQDMAMIQTAVVEDWPVNADHMREGVERLAEIVKKKTVTIPCGEGVFESEAVADANAMKATAILKSMVDAKVRRKQAANPQNPQTTINVGVNVDNRTDERRDRALAIAERFRNGRVLVSDSSESDR